MTSVASFQCTLRPAQTDRGPGSVLGILAHCGRLRWIYCARGVPRCNRTS